MNTHLEGVAYLPEPGEEPESWEVPEELPLRVNFSMRSNPVGRARLTKHPDGTITMTAEVFDDELARQLCPSLPKFAIGVRDPFGSVPQVASVSLVEENQNREIPPYEVLP
jgi:hypothetical protein